MYIYNIDHVLVATLPLVFFQSFTRKTLDSLRSIDRDVDWKLISDTNGDWVIGS